MGALRMRCPILVLGVVALERAPPELPPTSPRRSREAELLLALGNVAQRAQSLGVRLERLAKAHHRACTIAAHAQLASLGEQRLAIALAAECQRRPRDERDQEAGSLKVFQRRRMHSRSMMDLAPRSMRVSMVWALGSVRWDSHSAVPARSFGSARFRLRWTRGSAAAPARCW